MVSRKTTEMCKENINKEITGTYAFLDINELLQDKNVIVLKLKK